MLYVIDAKYEGGYRIWLRFSDGASGIVDLESDLWGPVFEPLRVPEKFKRFRVSEVFHTLVWENDADFAPEHLRGKIVLASNV